MTDARDYPDETESEEQAVAITGDGQRLDVLLSAAADLSRSRIAGLIEKGFCTVDGIPETKAGTRPKQGARICLKIPAPQPAVPQPENIPLEVLYQDEDLAVVVKPAGMVTHPAPGNENGTLVNALLYHLDTLGGIGGELRPGIVHRLDKDTSGLMLVAKNDQAQQALSAQLAGRTVEKHYLALVEGSMKEPQGLIDAPIARSKNDRKKMAIDPEGRESRTEWRQIAAGNHCSLLDVHILTGRTHQIRVHMRSIGHPVCGDPIYGSGRGVRVPRLMLHAWRLRFMHPSTGAWLSFEAPPPEAFRKGLRQNGIAEIQE